MNFYFHCALSQGLAAFLKAIGYLIPLMDAEYANYYTREVMLILIREFQSPDEEMKKIVLKVKKHIGSRPWCYKTCLTSGDLSRGEEMLTCVSPVCLRLT